MTRTSRSANCIASGSDSGTKVTRLCSRIVTLDRGTATVKALQSDGRPTLMGGLRPRELDQRDLGRRAEPERRPPVPRAPADIQPHRLESVQPRDERLK